MIIFLTSELQSPDHWVLTEITFLQKEDEPISFPMPFQSPVGSPSPSSSSCSGTSSDSLPSLYPLSDEESVINTDFEAFRKISFNQADIHRWNMQDFDKMPIIMGWVQRSNLKLNNCSKERYLFHRACFHERYKPETDTAFVHHFKWESLTSKDLVITTYVPPSLS